MEDIFHQIYKVQKTSRELDKAINARDLAYKDWNILREKDENSYKNWNNDKVPNYRTKEENFQFSNLSKQISSLNNQISGYRKTLREEEQKLLNIVQKNRYSTTNV